MSDRLLRQISPCRLSGDTFPVVALVSRFEFDRVEVLHDGSMAWIGRSRIAVVHGVPRWLGE